MGAAQRDQVVAGNESMFRRVNEAIERGRWPGEDGECAFRCECARSGCAQLLDVTQAAYEQVRAHPRRFILVPGHEDPEFEDVIECSLRYVVVQKRGQAGQIAEEADPRS